jgi:transcriptional regulator with XRE-family HTH domain
MGRAEGPADPGEFGPVLRSLRLAAGLTQEDLAERAGLSVRTISDLERGATGRPYPKTVTLLAHALELTEADRAELIGAFQPTTGGLVRQPGPSRAGPPRELPAAPANFTGRSAELEALGGLLGRESDEPGTVMISAIGGTAGVGKPNLEN